MLTIYVVHETQENPYDSGPFLAFTRYEDAEAAMERYEKAYPQHEYSIVNLTLDPSVEDSTP